MTNDIGNLLAYGVSILVYEVFVSSTFNLKILSSSKFTKLILYYLHVETFVKVERTIINFMI